MDSMFCYQCEQAARGTGCTDLGVCGKEPEVARLQDLLLYVTKAMSRYAHRTRQLGVADAAFDRPMLEALFSTVTNVNFDTERLASQVQAMARLRDAARAAYERACRAAGSTPDALGEDWQPAGSLDAMVAQAEAIGLEFRLEDDGETPVGLQELLTYGLKGMAAYAHHAAVLGHEDDAVYAFCHEALDFLTRPASIDELLAMNLRCGEVNLRVLELLDAANTGTYGDPVPTPVRTAPLAGKAILVSGHDLKDLEALLEQTAGTGINVYTHGEMLPAHGYPGLKKYPHLAGHYGGAWQLQWAEFATFPGAILMTTNCLQEPLESYRDRLFTCGLVAWPNTPHIADRDFGPVIAAALAAPGFVADGGDETITVGFGHGAILGVADTVIEAVKAGALRRFFLIGGCDGARPGRSYYTRFAEAVPDDCVILTLGCGKFRFNRHDFGTLGGLPRLLDCGQCNDAYTAIKVAVALAEAFGCGVNDLPLSLVISWYEQKAVCILLTLLHLGVRNVRLGPSLPAFVTPPVLDVLVKQFGLLPITTPEADLAAALGN